MWILSRNKKKILTFTSRKGDVEEKVTVNKNKMENENISDENKVLERKLQTVLLCELESHITYPKFCII